LGGTRVSRFDFRLIAATQENLGQRVEQGKFRKDLYYRLNVIPIQIPPLKERKEDIRVITEHLVNSLNKDLGMNVTRISPEVISIFEKYDWQGNVRELSNVLERILYSMEGDTIDVNHLPFFLQSIRSGVTPYNPASLKMLREEMEREALVQAIRLANNNKKAASVKLGIHRTALYKKMKKLNIPIK
jgi:transcriptional regulator with PAS, ATPase and Fis domain